jgi:hypothetical protein
VERKIRSVKEFKIVKHFQVSNFGKETTENHWKKVETIIDCVFSLVNLNVLASLDRLDLIKSPDQNPPTGSILSNLTDLNRCVNNKSIKLLPASVNAYPTHIRDFINALKAIGPEIERERTKKARLSSFLKTSETVWARGLNLVDSGYVAHLTVSRDPTVQDLWIVYAKVYPSMMKDPYHVAIRMKPGAPFFDYRCSCTKG